MNKQSKIYVAGHDGLVGSAIMRKLKNEGYNNVIYKPFSELDLRNQKQTLDFFEKNKPEYVFLAAARVGGIIANSTYKADFIYDNIMIAANVINASYQTGVVKLLNLGSSCIYPKYSPQPMKEDYLLTDELEPTNEPYAIAKISAIKMCRYFNEQYKTNFISIMPTNLFGPYDNFDLDKSHVLPALIRKFHLNKLLSISDFDGIRKDLNYFDKKNNYLEYSNENIVKTLNNYGIYKNKVDIWGTGKPKREFLYVDDLANAAIFLMNNKDYNEIGEFVNVGTGKDIEIAELAVLIKDIVKSPAQIVFDKSKPDGTPRKLLDVSRLNKLGWKACIKFSQGIKTTYKWYVENS